MKCGLLNSIKKSFLRALSKRRESIKFYNIRLFLLIAIFEIQSPLAAELGSVNIEKYIQDFVLETHRVIVPEIPHGFNPSVIRWKGDLLMTFREISNAIPGLYSGSESNFYIVKVDENFNPVSTPQRIPLENGDIPSRLEDPRLINVGDRLYLVYSDNKEEIPTEGGVRVNIAELSCENGEITVLHIECLSDFEGMNPHIREKNWVPFDYEGHLLLAYTLTPHKIFYPLLDDTGTCETYITTRPSVVWEWGDLRGGTPGVVIEEGYYLAFFHSCIELETTHSHGLSSLHYFIGAYLFEQDPPYKIKKISPEPIVGRNFYEGQEYDPYWKPVNVVFPCGILIENDTIWMTYGRQDHEMWVAKIDKKGLLESLVHVSTVRVK